MNERDLFIAALQQESRAQRQKYLDEACCGDATLRRNVEALLEIHERAGGFLQEPVLVQAAGAAQERDTSRLGDPSTRAFPPREKSTDSEAEGDASELPSLSFLAPPQQPDELGRLGPFRVLRLLGAGGMGVVFEAEDTQLRRPVALKVMLPAVAASSNARRRFLREAQAAAAIEHDHIIHINQVGDDNGVPFVSMPLLHGEPLNERLAREGKLPVAEVLRIGREVAEGLAAAHQHGLIHRDVKPANIWLEAPNARVKLLDFGLARSVADTDNLTQQGVVVGTPSYMSPEQAGGQPVDTRSDLFSLGAVLYRMATGKEPFSRGDTIATLVAVATDPARPPHEVAPDVPASLSALILRLLAKAPASRPTSAAEVARALLALEQGAAPVAPARRRRLALAGVLGLAGLALSLVVAALAGAFRGRPDDDRGSTDAAPSAPVSPQNNASAGTTKRPALPPIREFTLTGHASQIQSLAFTADGKTLVSAEYRPAQVKFWDMDSRKTTFEMVAVPGGLLQCLALDPKRHWLAVSPMSAADKPHPGIRLFRFGAPVLVTLLKGHTDRVLQLAFLKDGRTLLSTGFDGSIRRWDVETHKQGQPLRAGGPRLDCLNVWEDGRGGLRLALAGADGGRPRNFASLDNAVLERFSYGPAVAVLSPDGTRLACSKQERVARARESFVALWDVPGKASLGELAEAPRPEGLAFTPNGKHILVMATDSTRIYETASGKPVARVDHPEKGGALAVSPDGRWLAVGTLKGPIHVWHLPSLLAPGRSD